MIIWGWRRKGDVEWSGLLECPTCARWRIHYGIRIKRWLTIFFIPLVPLWGDRETMCAVCTQKQKVGAADFPGLGERAKRNLRLAEQYQDNPQEQQRQLALAAAGDAPAATQQLEPA
jgi:hypothetical protein